MTRPRRKLRNLAGRPAISPAITLRKLRIQEGVLLAFILAITFAHEMARNQGDEEMRDSASRLLTAL